MTDRRIFIATNDISRAALNFCCHPGNLPDWLVIVSDPWAFPKIPEGAKACALFYGWEGVTRAWRDEWTVAKVERGLDALTEAEWDAVMGWVFEHRYRPSIRLLYGVDVPAIAVPAIVGSPSVISGTEMIGSSSPQLPEGELSGVSPQLAPQSRQRLSGEGELSDGADNARNGHCGAEVLL